MVQTQGHSWLRDRWLLWAGYTSLRYSLVGGGGEESSYNEPTFLAGSGWSGPTTASDTGGGSTAIAQFDVIPDQDLSAGFEMGVVAFHISGIDRVEFAVEGGDWVSATQMSRNPRTKVFEYWATFEPSSASAVDTTFVEVRAVAYPNGNGTPRVLTNQQFINLTPSGATTWYVATSGEVTGPGDINNPYDNFQHAVNAMDDFGGDTVLFNQPGMYDIRTGRSGNDHLGERWTSCRPGPGLSREDIVIVGLGNDIEPRIADRDSARPYAGHLKWEGISFDFNRITNYYHGAHPMTVWFDNCMWFDSSGWAEFQNYNVSGQLDPVRTRTTSAPYHATNCTASDTGMGFTNCSGIIRDCSSYQIGADAVNNTQLMINCQVEKMDGDLISWHSDTLQTFGNIENMIVYGYKTWGLSSIQGIFNDPDQTTFNNCAFVNCMFDTFTSGDSGDVSGTPFTQFNSRHEHFLFYNITVLSQLALFRDDFSPPNQFSASDVSFRNCLWHHMGISTGPGLPSGVNIENNHFVVGPSFGTNSQEGDVTFVNASGLSEFSYAGAAAGTLTGAGIVTDGYTHPNMGATSGTVAPNIGAYPFADTGNG